MLSKKELRIMCKTLGLDDKGKGKSHRNYFYTREGSDTFDFCYHLVSLNLMAVEKGPLPSSGVYFTVTNAGELLLPALLTGCITGISISDEK